MAKDFVLLIPQPLHLLSLFTIYWSDVEARPGVFDWSALDRRIALWTGAGKKVALRMTAANLQHPA